MAQHDLYNLYKLHQVDSAIQEIKTRAAAFDPTRETRAKIAKLKPSHDEAVARHKTMHTEQTDLELQQKSLRDKAKKLNDDLYSGKIVNPREVETIQKEIETIKRKVSEMDDRLFEIMDQLPSLAAAAEVAVQQMKALEAEGKAAYQAGLKEKQAMEAEFKALSARRNDFVKPISVALLAQYNAIRAKYGGIGVAELTPQGACSRCGMVLPTKLVLAVQEEKLVTCESCHRIFYFPGAPE